MGESAAIFVSFMWTLCSILFAAAGKRLGILGLNAYRTIMALSLLSCSHIILFGTIVPEANSLQWSVLAVSGIIGLGIGDFGYFGALVNIGPRRGLLIMSTHPIFSLLAAYLILGEIPGPWSSLGIAVTLLGVFIVIIEEEEEEVKAVACPVPVEGEKEKEKEEMIDGTNPEAHEHTTPEPVRETIQRGLKGDGSRSKGIVFGFVGAIGQGLGFVLAKYGMEDAASSGSDSLDPLSATLIRMIAACIFIWVVITLSGNLPMIRGKLRERRALKLAFGGAIFGPFIGVWMSMVALSYTLAGVAATLMSLMPVIVIPVVWIVYRQKTNIRGIIGAVIAVIGVAILFLA